MTANNFGIEFGNWLGWVYDLSSKYSNSNVGLIRDSWLITSHHIITSHLWLSLPTCLKSPCSRLVWSFRRISAKHIINHQTDRTGPVGIPKVLCACVSQCEELVTWIDWIDVWTKMNRTVSNKDQWQWQFTMWKQQTKVVSKTWLATCLPMVCQIMLK